MSASQERLVEAYLLAGHSLTPNESQALFGARALASRVCNINRRYRLGGNPGRIVGEKVKVGPRTWVACYHYDKGV